MSQINNSNYGIIIGDVRREKGLSVQDMANIMLMPADRLEDVELGNGKLTETEINLCSNILGLSASALKQGVRSEIKEEQVLKTYLDMCSRQIKSAQQSEAFFLSVIQEFSPPERYYARYGEEFELMGFCVYDTKLEDLVRDETGQPVMYRTAKEALDSAKEMEMEIKNLADKMQTNVSKEKYDTVDNQPDKSSNEYHIDENEVSFKL